MNRSHEAAESSVLLKRPKLDENVASKRKARKNKYFFQPIDNIKRHNTKEREVLLPTNDNVSQERRVKNTVTGVRTSKEKMKIDVSNELIEVRNNIDHRADLLEHSENHPTHEVNAMDHREVNESLIKEDNLKIPENYKEHHSSEYSDEGIRWKSSPKRVHPKLCNSLPSSPLKAVNTVSPRISSTLINEQADSLLRKYGYDANVISQTPAFSRTRSDISSSRSHHLDNSPTLEKSKSSADSSLKSFKKPISNQASSLSSWISKFEKNSESSGSLEVVSKLTIEEKQQSERSSDDPFSDDEELLAILQTQAVGVSKSLNIDIASCKNSSPSPAFLDSKVEQSESDPFSDVDNEVALHKQDHDKRKGKKEVESDPFSDDLDLDAIGKLMSQTQDLHGQNAMPQSKFQQQDLKSHEDTDSDPFSDDDLDFVAINQMSKSQKSTTMLKYSVSFKADLMKADSDSRFITQSDENTAKIAYTRPDFLRFQILDIMSSTFKVNERVRSQLIVTVKDGEGKISKLIIRGEYANLNFQKLDVVHIILTAPDNPRLVDDNHNLLIWNPDILISSTTVAEQLKCARKSVIKSRFRFPGETNIHFIIGIIIHEVFQSCFVKELWSLEYMREVMESLVESYRIQIYSLGDIREKVVSEVETQLPYLESWFLKYYRRPSTSVATGRPHQQVMMAISDALDIEETVWSPMFGIKGMVDVTLDASFRDQKSQKRVLLPMEIKSGKESIAHHAQATLYALLFKDRYDIDAISFLLVYTKEKITKKMDVDPNDLKALVNLRNRLSLYLKENTTELPDLKRMSECDWCEIREPCMTINNMVDDGTPEGSGIDEDLYKSLTGHLNGNQTYKSYYSYWDNLISKEESLFFKLKKDLWLLTGKERETEQGKALSNLKILNSDDAEEEDGQHFRYTFTRDTNSDITSSFQHSQLVKYDKIIVSDESGRFHIAGGYIQQIRPDSITILSRRRILATDFSKNAFNGGKLEIRSVLHRTQRPSQFHTQVSQSQSFNQSNGPDVTYRIDKDDMFYGMGLARFNILNLFLASGDPKRRQLVVDLREPQFSKNSCIDIPNKSNFNSDQIAAFEKVFTAKDYSLILGMPGTGKTTVIAQLIKFIVDNNKTVLLASYTHSAVDNILMKVKDFGIDILRVGTSARNLHKDLAKFDPNTKDIKGYDEFVETYHYPQVVAVTCLGISDIAFSIRDQFDYCIIDEASQVSLPVSLGPLRFCDKFVLVGDHFQLPPLVTNPDPEVRAGLSQSLFKVLAEKHPKSLVELTYQYRMCEEIMLLSNALVYDFRLKCGSELVANQFLAIPHPERIKDHMSNTYGGNQSNLWMDLILQEKNKVLFLNHDNMPALERSIGEKTENPTEVELVKHIVNALTSCGVSENSIGVMSLYRHQLRALTRNLFDKPDVEVLTADQFQGRDKDCIIISLVKSNKEKKVGDLLKEWRRINVAVTRSKSKLILLGSKSTLSNGATLKLFIDLLEEKGWVYDLPNGADKVYDFLDNQSQRPSRHRPSPSKPIGAFRKDSKIIQSHPIIRDIVRNATE